MSKSTTVGCPNSECYAGQVPNGVGGYKTCPTCNGNSFVTITTSK